MEVFQKASEGNEDAIKELMRLGEALKAVDDDGCTPLLRAAKKGEMAFIRALAALGSDINMGDVFGNTPLHFIVQLGCGPSALRELVQLGADVAVLNVDGDSPLLASVKKCTIEDITALCEMGSDVNEADFDGCSPVYHGAVAGSCSVISILAEFGANISLPDCDGCTPMHIAAESCHVDVIELLARLGANANTLNNAGDAPIIVAANRGNIAAVEALVHVGANINIPDDDGYRAIHYASQNGHVDLIYSLARNGADINLSAHGGCTPVYVASREGLADVIEVLSSLGADVNIPSDNGHTAVHIAAAGGFADVVKTLMKLGADIDATSDDGSTALFNACQDDQTEAVVMLFRCGANILQSMNECAAESPLHVTVKDFCQRANLDFNLGEAICPLVSLTNLMMSVTPSETLTFEFDNSMFEASVARIMNSLPLSHSFDIIQQLKYPAKRKLCEYAWKCYLKSCKQNSSCPQTNALCYIDFVHLIFDRKMLRDLFSLRLSCKANNELRRFPVCYTNYHELETNLIESYIAYGSSRFLPTSALYQMLLFRDSFD